LLRLVTAFIVVFAAGCAIANAESDQIKRGDYLVNGILTCGNCHTPIAVEEQARTNDQCTNSTIYAVVAEKVKPCTLH
jgi:hypothetical protein